jgi:hypothetical protein
LRHLRDLWSGGLCPGSQVLPRAGLLHQCGPGLLREGLPGALRSGLPGLCSGLPGLCSSGSGLPGVRCGLPGTLRSGRDLRLRDLPVQAALLRSVFRSEGPVLPSLRVVRCADLCGVRSGGSGLCGLRSGLPGLRCGGSGLCGLRSGRYLRLPDLPMQAALLLQGRGLRSGLCGVRSGGSGLCGLRSGLPGLRCCGSGLCGLRPGGHLRVLREALLLQETLLPSVA